MQSHSINYDTTQFAPFVTSRALPNTFVTSQVLCNTFVKDLFARIFDDAIFYVRKNS